MFFCAFWGCSRINDIENELDEHEQRISALEILCAQLNTNISSLETITQALENRDYITSVSPILSEGKIVGYTITFNNSTPVTVYNGATNSSAAPVFGTKEDGGKWYWTLNGQWLKDSKGEKIEVDAATPILKIENKKWYVSYDDGQTWQDVGTVATSQMFIDIKVEDDTVTMTLYDGTLITLPVNTSDYFNLPSGVIILNGEPRDVYKDEPFTIAIRVNPSNFNLKLENIDFKVKHNIYSCCTLDSLCVTNPVYDPSVQSEFKAVDLKKDESEQGVYYIQVKAEGKGNYYDFAQFYVLINAVDQNGEKSNVCSSSKAEVAVTPKISEGLHIEALPQSLYYIDEDGKIDKSTPKPFILTMKSNLYVNQEKEVTMYSREEIKLKEISEGLYASLDTSIFYEYGFAYIKPDFSDQHWKEYLSLESSQDSVSIPNQSIIIERSGRGGVISETLSFDFNVRFAVKDQPTPIVLSISKDKLNDYSSVFTHSYYDFHEKAGFYLYYDKSYWSCPKYSPDISTTRCNADLILSKDKYDIATTFALFHPTVGKAAYTKSYVIVRITGQLPNGNITPILDSKIINRLLNVYMVQEFDFVE